MWCNTHSERRRALQFRQQKQIVIPQRLYMSFYAAQAADWGEYWVEAGRISPESKSSREEREAWNWDSVLSVRFYWSYHGNSHWICLINLNANMRCNFLCSVHCSLKASCSPDQMPRRMLRGFPPLFGKSEIPHRVGQCPPTAEAEEIRRSPKGRGNLQIHKWKSTHSVF